ncbi:type III PLP-dependent enzyme [Streptomyces sp. NPDC057702]|uniref:type III PLP-dependent enzyme n=1 Tax=unclassified Streptomyces TaxID=2593676 RepID=UPI0036B5A296
MYATTPLHTALAAAHEDRIVYDLAGIAAQHATLVRELPGIGVRFAMKACPVDEVLARLARDGAGFDAASPAEIAQALAAGAPHEAVHFGNTVKSDRHIAEAHRMGVRDFATDSVEDVRALARHAPGARVFCRLATDGAGALWGLSRKFGCTPSDAVRVMVAARAAGLTPAGLSFHVGSQQMTAGAWRTAIDRTAGVITELARRGIRLDHVNLGGGLPAPHGTDRAGNLLDPPLDKIFAVLREGMHQLRAVAGTPLDFLIEPGRHLVADHGAIRAHVARLSAREQLGGERAHWLYLSCGKFNGLYEMDGLQYPLHFPTHAEDAPRVPAVIAGPTCDSDDAYDAGGALVHVPADLASGDPVWITSCGAYATSYTTQGFNGFSPLPYAWIDGDRAGRGTTGPPTPPPPPRPRPEAPR